MPVPLTTSYTYDSEDIVLQTQSDGTATIATQYVHGPGIDEPLAMVAGGQSYYYHADGLGSIVAISDSAQNVVERYSYDAFGMVMASDPGFANSYAYTGREWDMELGLYYYRARYYDPMEGRFVSKDPIGFAGGDVNVYRYVQNNPINRLDPTGLAWIYDTGTNTLQQTDSSGNVTNSWPAGSGPWGNGQLPPGTYTLPSPPVPVPPNHPNQPSYCDGSGNCWWQPITPNFPTNRTGLGIHPDGNVPGTAGCIGATDNDTNNLRDALMNDQGPLTVR